MHDEGKGPLKRTNGAVGHLVRHPLRETAAPDRQWADWGIRWDDVCRWYYRLTRLWLKVLELECERLQEMLRMMQKKRKLEV
jgi:hypothetical protein